MVNVRLKSKFRLPEKAEAHIRKLCDKLKLRWIRYADTGQVPETKDLIATIKSKGKMSDQARFELSRRLLRIDIEHRSQAGLHVSPEIYRESAMIKCLSVIEEIDLDSVLEPNDVHPTDELTILPTGPGKPKINEGETINQSSTETHSMNESSGFVFRPWRFLDPPLEEGDLGRIGDYRIITTLGSGGMGTVFLAQDINLLRDVAIKVLHEGTASDEQSQQRFLREVRAMAAIESEHVIQVYHVGEFKDVVFMVMPVLKGETLATRIASGTIERSEAFRIAKEIALGLSAAHQKGLTHRDIKPANIWLEGESATVKVLDFGLVRTGGDSLKTVDGTVLGTPRYMSPEQARGKPASPASDLFSLGAVLYEMLGQRPAFGGETLYSILLAVSGCEFTPIKDHASDLDSEEATLVHQLLSVSPEDRPESAAFVAQLLDQFPVSAESAKPAGQEISDSREVAQAASGSMFGVGARRWVLVGLAAFAFFAACFTTIVVLKFRGKDGTVIVELDGEVEISEIEIDGNKVRFETDDGTVRFDVDPGKHTLSLKTDTGIELNTNLTDQKLTIGAGENVTVKAYWESNGTISAHEARPSDANESEQAYFKANRDAAEWAIKSGGRVQVRQNDERSEVSDISDLPSDDFVVTRLLFTTTNAKLVNSQFGVLSKLSEFHRPL